jgi:hypothetical protein
MRYVLGLVCALLSNVPTTAQRLHVIYALEKNDRAYGLLNLQNETHVNQIMETVKWGIAYPMTTSYLPKTDFTSAALRRTIAALKTTAKDIVVLYYSGFGTPPATQGATFANWRLTDVPTRGLPVSEVESWLLAKKVRLCVIFADCSAERTRNDTQLAATMAVMPDRRKQVIQNLFLNTCGLVKLGSSLPSQPAWVLERNNGTLFTAALSSAFDGVLRLQDPAQVASASWGTIDQFAGMSMNMALVRMPFSQQPVLEQRSCRPVVAATPAPLPQPDPLANETIASVLNAFATTQDSARRTYYQQQLLAMCSPQATVRVERLLDAYKPNTLPPNAPLFSRATLDSVQTQLNALPTQYTLANYTAQVRRPLPSSATPPGSAPLPLPRFRVVYVVDKQVDATVGKVTALTLSEAWVLE